MKKSSLLAITWLLQFSLLTLAQQPNASPQPKSSPTPTPPATTQQPPPVSDEDVVRITTNLVQVDAVITDKSGKPIADLKQEEVRVFEDGKPQKITHFSYVVTGTKETTRPPRPGVTDKNAAPIPPVALKREQVRRTIAIVVDDLGLSFESTAFVRRALKKFVDEQMQAGDLVALIRTAAGIGALQQFTADKRLLNAAIEHLKWYPNGRGGIHAVAPLEGDPIAEAVREAEGPEVPTEYSGQSRAETFSVGTLGALRYVVRGLRELPGRKSILLISDGFAINGRYEESLQHLIDQASRASVVIYTMNATGLQTFGLSAADDVTTKGVYYGQVDRQLEARKTAALKAQQGLDYLAKESGGIAIHDTNDLSGGIRRVMEDQSGYYLIGYRPDQFTFDPKTGRRTFHKLSLRVTRPGSFTARMHNGFYGIRDEDVHPAPRTPQQQVIAALASPFGATGVHLQLTSLFANDPKGSFMRSMLHIRASDLTFTDEADGWHKAIFDVVAVTSGEDGTTVDQIGRIYTMHVPAPAYEQVLKNGFVYYMTVRIKKPGAYHLRVALRDEKSERLGSASQFIEVPEVKKDRLALSGLVLDEVEPAAYNRTKAGQGTSPQSAGRLSADEQVDQRDPEASPALRHFRLGWRWNLFT